MSGTRWDTADTVSAPETWVVQAEPGVVARFHHNCDRAGLLFRAMRVHGESISQMEPRHVEDEPVAPLLLKLDKAAKVLDLSLSSVRRLVKTGELPSVRVNGSVRIRPRDLAEYVEHLAQSDADGLRESI